VQRVWGRSPPTLICVPIFIPQNKRHKWRQNSTGLTPRELKFLLNRFLKRLNFFLLTSFIYVCSFYHGKFGKMGNLAGWKHEERMHEHLGYLRNKSSSAQNKMQRLRMQRCFAFVLLGSLHLSTYGPRSVCGNVGV
jgi:hypothetical protein